MPKILFTTALLLRACHGLPVGLHENGNGEYTSDGDVFALVMVLVSLVLSALMGLAVVGLVVFTIVKTWKDKKSVKLETMVPGQLDDEFEIEERLRDLSPNEQNLYRSGQDYIKQYPPFNEELSLSTHMAIQEKGVQAWEFIPDPSLPNDAIVVQDRTELHFTSFDYQCSIQTNLPIPKINDVYYYEVKMYQLDSPVDTLVSLGLSTKPYPYFRLPGRHLYSVAYDSNGTRRVNNSFKLSDNELDVFPKLKYGDVIGVGYRVRSGTIFFTRNGKKVSEKSLGGHIKGMRMNNIFPTIGSNNPCVLHVNLGQAGYVFIEANIKKWGYGSREGSRPPLPEYNTSSQDLLLESSNEDDEDIIDPPDFFANTGYESSSTSLQNSAKDIITLNTLPPDEPPVYDDEDPNAVMSLQRITEHNQFLNDDDDHGYDGDHPDDVYEEEDDDDDIRRTVYEARIATELRETSISPDDSDANVHL